MILQSKNQEPRIKNLLVVSVVPVLSSWFLVLRHLRWARLLLLTLAVVGLSAVGAALGRGFESGAQVVSQAVGPTIATLPTLAPEPASGTAQVPTAAPIQAAAAPAAPSAGLQPPPAAPLDTAHGWERWPLRAEEHFDGLAERWPEVRSSPSWSSSYQDGGYLMQVDSRPGISYSGPLGAHDFWYSADVRITRGQAGLFFLIGRPNDFYRLLVDTAGRYQLEWQQVGVSQPLIAWTSSDALRRGDDQINQIAVARTGDVLTLYANGALLASYSLPPSNQLESRIGLALTRQRAAAAGWRGSITWWCGHPSDRTKNREPRTGRCFCLSGSWFSALGSCNDIT